MRHLMLVQLESKERLKNINQGKQTDFWSLKLPKETSKYLPRLLALLEVIKNPEDYNVSFPFCLQAVLSSDRHTISSRFNASSQYLWSEY